MYSSRFWLYLSLALAALLSLSNAIFGLEERQIDATISDIPAAPSDTISTPGAVTTSLPEINAPTTTSTSSTSSSTSDTSTTTTPTITSPTTSNQTTTSTSTSTSSSSSSSTSSTPVFTPTSTPSTSESSPAITTPSVTTVPRSTVLVVVTLDGSTFTTPSTSFAASTASGIAAASTDLSTSSSGMSTQTRSTIIGATVGIGGAIILAGLGFVAWRLWGKRAPRMDEDEILMAGSNAHGEKLTGSSGSQFRSNLDQYHAHSGTNF